MKVCAAVVSYNRKHLLVECLEALLRQTHPVERICVIDNASTDGTPELLEERGYLRRPEVLYHRIEKNVGGAGGFSCAFEVGGEADCEWLWLMDDDAEPAPDALELMLRSPAAGTATTAALCPKVVDTDGRIEENHRGNFKGRQRNLPLSAYNGGAPAIGYSTFVGMMVRSTAVRELDPPRADFFIWGDDIEYSFRLRERGEIRLVPESVVVHKDPRNLERLNRRSRFWNRLTGWEFGPTPTEEFWKNLCGLRNYIWIKRQYEGQSALGAIGTTAQFVVKSLLYDERPVRRLPWIVRFARDGRRGAFLDSRRREWLRVSQPEGR